MEECLRLDVLFIIDIKCYDIRVSNCRPVVYKQVTSAKDLLLDVENYTGTDGCIDGKLWRSVGAWTPHFGRPISTPLFIAGSKPRLSLKCDNRPQLATVLLQMGGHISQLLNHISCNQLVENLGNARRKLEKFELSIGASGQFPYCLMFLGKNYSVVIYRETQNIFHVPHMSIQSASPSSVENVTAFPLTSRTDLNLGLHVRKLVV